ncbi:hypothetical protein B0T17DRAFT_545193 [Bombardia bombarda]|uniref:Uncharacterized protein n=1 Tax=Bombardia bombarda TaxID=252184 RepID=A0AA39W450_9PEZI|nr:hypothetical protein B0T17DRAFT_545193 [Bombardia bombarda]
MNQHKQHHPLASQSSIHCAQNLFVHQLIMSRTIYLIIYKSPIFPAHWALWIPSQNDPTIGKIINADGDAKYGFELAIERNYDTDQIGRTHRIVQLGQVEDNAVDDDDGCVKGELTSTDCHPRDAVERVAMGVPAPGPSLVSALSSGPRQRVRIKNCQTWLREVVERLVHEKIIDKQALVVLDGAPKN